MLHVILKTVPIPEICSFPTLDSAQRAVQFIMRFFCQIELDNLYQLIRILRVRSIAGSLQALCPASIVGRLQIEEGSITLTGREELRMILIRFEGGTICPKALVVASSS